LKNIRNGETQRQRKNRIKRMDEAFDIYYMRPNRPMRTRATDWDFMKNCLHPNEVQAHGQGCAICRFFEESEPARALADALYMASYGTSTEFAGERTDALREELYEALKEIEVKGFVLVQASELQARGRKK
jgi:hypothetical protein